MHRPLSAAALAAAAIFTIFQVPTAQAQSKELTLTASPDAIVHFREGWAATEVLNVASSLKHFKLALDRDPGFGLARAMYVSQQGAAPSVARTAELNRAVADAAKGSTGELLLAMALREAAENRQAAGSTLLRAAATLMPTDEYIAIAAAQSAGGDANARLASAKEIATRFPQYGPAYNSIAYGSWAAGDHEGAIAAALKQVQLTPKNPNAHDTYAEMVQWSGKLPDALMHYGEAVKLDSGFTESYIGMAEVEALQGHYDKARSYVNMALVHNAVPAQKLAYMRDLAGIDALTGNGKTAVPQLLAIASQAKADGNLRAAAVTYAQIAAVSATAGDAKAAHSYLDMARATFAEPSAPVNYYAAVAHGWLKHWEPANAAIAAAKAAPDFANLGGRLAGAEAFLATSQGKPADAIALLSGADLTDPVIERRLADAYAASGRAADAMKLQQQIGNDYALNLVDWPAANARYRARMALMPGKNKK